MTYSPLQIEIIKAFGSKQLSEGCLLNISYTGLEHREMGGDDYELNIKKEIVGKYVCESNGDDFDFYYDFAIYNFRSFGEDSYANDYEILGNRPELFPDVARVAEEKGKHMEVRTMIYDRIEFSVKENPYPICIPYNPTISFLEQSEETLTKLLNIFKPS